MKRWLAVMLLALALPAAARATTMLPMYLDDLTAASQTVVYGKVVAARTEWDDAHRLIYTIYSIAPSEYLKGQLGPTFELREPGGERDGVGVLVPGVPKFAVGEQDVLFVWTDPKGNNQVAALEQGAVAVATDPATGAQSASRAIALGSARLPQPAAAPPGTSRSLPQLFDQIRASIVKTSQGRAGN